VLSTGDEVVPIDVSPGPTQIRNSNSYSLAVQIQNAGGEPILLPIASDELQQLRASIREGLADADLLLVTGGISMGKYDLVEQVLTELQAEFYFTGAQIQPGRPVVFGSCGSVVPTGLGSSSPLSPALKRRAIISRPCGAKTSAALFHRIAQNLVLTQSLPGSCAAAPVTSIPIINAKIIAEVCMLPAQNGSV